MNIIICFLEIIRRHIFKRGFEDWSRVCKKPAQLCHIDRTSLCSRTPEVNTIDWAQMNRLFSLGQGIRDL
jgi:hypothetical protein